MSSNHIYPYVYKLINKETGQFYIGYRGANKVRAEDDIGFKYFSSSPKIKKSWDSFEIIIIAEFFQKSSAYDFEQELIYENWGQPTLLNKACFYGKSRFDNTGNSPTKETRNKLSRASKGRFVSDETKLKMSIASKNRTPEYHKKLSDRLKGRILDIEWKRKISETKKLSMQDPEIRKRQAKFKGKSHSIETREKMSEKSLGKGKSAVHKENISKSLKGKTKSPEHIQNLVLSQTCRLILP